MESGFNSQQWHTIPYDYFLDIAGIQGESNNFQHNVQIDSFSWGVSQPSCAASGSGGGAGKVQMQDFHFVTNVNPATPDVLAAMRQGDRQIKVTLDIRQKDPTKIGRITYKLQESIVSSYRTQGTERSTPQEEISLNFGRMNQSHEVEPGLPPVAAAWSFDPASPPEYQEGASILDDTTPDGQAHELFLSIEGVMGESADDNHRGSIELNSYRWGLTQSISSADRSIGRLKFEDFQFEADHSAASVELMGLLAQGKHIAKATLSVRKAGGKQEDYISIRFFNAAITTYQSQGTDGVVATNSISLSPEQIEFTYFPARQPGEIGTRAGNAEVLFADPGDLLESG